jgi:hypothetical protein
MTSASTFAPPSNVISPFPGVGVFDGVSISGCSCTCGRVGVLGRLSAVGVGVSGVGVFARIVEALSLDFSGKERKSINLNEKINPTW